VFRNTFKDIDFAVTALSATGTRFEFECYDVGHLYNFAHFVDRNLVQAAVPGADRVRHPRWHRHASRGRDAYAAQGRPPFRCRLSLVRARSRSHANAERRMAVAMGAHVRVGLEDSLWIGKGRLAASNAEQVRQVRGIVEGLGLTPATPEEARDILDLKGADSVAF
jgi:uncharacterized protein (DUF849 family)